MAQTAQFPHEDVVGRQHAYVPLHRLNNDRRYFVCRQIRSECSFDLAQAIPFAFIVRDIDSIKWGIPASPVSILLIAGSV